jgi:hypothetical protein
MACEHFDRIEATKISTTPTNLANFISDIRACAELYGHRFANSVHCVQTITTLFPSLAAAIFDAVFEICRADRVAKINRARMRRKSGVMLDQSYARANGPKDFFPDARNDVQIYLTSGYFPYMDADRERYEHDRSVGRGNASISVIAAFGAHKSATVIRSFREAKDASAGPYTPW